MWTMATPGRRPRTRHGSTAFRIEVMKHPMAKRGFALLPRRWVAERSFAWAERSFAWAARFRRLARDYERLANTLKGLHYIAFSILMLTRMLGLAL